jgi:chaperone required for assembly of F1-ATPase
MHPRQTSVTLGSNGYEITVNNKILMTYRQNVLRVPTAELAEAIAEEWEIYLLENSIRRENAPLRHYYRKKILFNSPFPYKRLPPLTAIACLAIDDIKNNRSEVILEILKILENDRLKDSYFTKSSISIKQNQYRLILLEWFKNHYGINFSKEIIDKQEMESMKQLLETRNCWALTVIQQLSHLTGSCILGVALSHRKIDPSVTFALADVRPHSLKDNKEKIARQRLTLRTFIIVAEQFLKLSRCWERNIEPRILNRSSSTVPSYTQKMANFNFLHG